MNSDSDLSVPRRPPGETFSVDRMAVGRFILGPDPAPPAPEVPGYEIVRFIARGGLGQVWKGRRVSDGSQVALKIALDDRPEITDRFTAEAEALRALDHPHIVRLLDITETSDERPVLVLEYVAGPTLALLVPEAGFPLDGALRIFLPVLDAVAHAHAKGIVHRDLKPSNILTDPAGQPKVADFGLAQPLEQRLVQFSLTRTGSVAGTVEYLAPECYSTGYRHAPSADIYALGVLLYELLTGAPPRGAWPPLSRIRRLDVRLDELLAELMAPDPSERPASVRALRARLEEIRASPPRRAGSPLVNRAVRAGDAFWTVAGLYLCAAGFCATLSHTRTPVPALFDLTFSSPGLLLRGFLAVWALSLGVGILWIWQLFRLWRFRHVPLREALPSPFGLALGSRPMAASVVGVTQFFCAWLPAVYTVVVVGMSFRWLQADTPVWDKFLVVTPWSTDEPVSPWRWHPEKIFDPGAYWLKEATGGYEPGSLRVVDKTSFFIFGQPFLMCLSAVITGAGMLVTTGLWFRSWWHGRRAAAVALALTGLLGAWWLAVTWSRDQDHRGHFTPEQIRLYADEWRLNYSRPALDRFYQTGFLGGGEFRMFPELRGIFAKKLDWMGQPGVTHLGIEKWFRRDRLRAAAENRTVEHLMAASGIVDSGKPRQQARWRYLCFTDPPGGPAEAARITITGKGRLSGTHGVSFYAMAMEKGEPYYRAERHPLPAAEAERFFAEWSAALASGDATRLSGFFLPLLFTDRRHQERESPVSALLAERARWGEFRLVPAEPMADPEPLPGARWRLRPCFRREGVRPGGVSMEASGPLRWTFEIVRVDNAWRVFRFCM